MKSRPFDYLRADSVEEAIDFLSRHGSDAKLMAGGQSLLPLMRLRLASPRTIIDISRLSELRYTREEGEGLYIGGLTRHFDLERSRLVNPFDVIAKLAGHIGHLPIRTAGSFGGSIAHADPAAELALLCVGLDADIEIRSGAGSRLVAAEDFFISMFGTVLEPEDLVIGAVFPRPAVPSFASFEEVSIRPGDFALVSVLAAGHPDESGIFRWIRLAVGAVESRPRRFLEAEDLLIGTSLTADVIEEAARTVAAAIVPLAADEADLRVRRHLVSSLVRQTLGDIRTQAAPAAEVA
jgi:CO/xanthine dehydrogenase FAD-binding subunit